MVVGSGNMLLSLLKMGGLSLELLGGDLLAKLLDRSCVASGRGALRGGPAAAAVLSLSWVLAQVVVMVDKMVVGCCCGGYFGTDRSCPQQHRLGRVPKRLGVGMDMGCQPARYAERQTDGRELHKRVSLVRMACRRSMLPKRLTGE